MDDRIYIADGLRAFLQPEQAALREDYLTGINNIALSLKYPA